MQIQLTGFLEGNTMKFMEELWNLLLSAQESLAGIPKEILEKKKQEIALKKQEQEKIAQAVRNSTRHDRDRVSVLDYD